MLGIVFSLKVMCETKHLMDSVEALTLSSIIPYGRIIPIISQNVLNSSFMPECIMRAGLTMSMGSLSV